MASSLKNAKIMAEFKLSLIQLIQDCESSDKTQNPDVSDFLNLTKAYVEAGSKTPLSEVVSNFTRSETIPTPCNFAEFANAFNRGSEPDDSQKVTEIPSEESEDELSSETEEAGYAAAASQPAQPAQPAQPEKIRDIQMALAVYGQDNMKFINSETSLEVDFSLDGLRHGTFYHLHGPFEVHGKKLIYNGSPEDFAIETAVFTGRLDSFNDTYDKPHMKIVSDDGPEFFCSDDFLTKYQLWEEDKKHVKFSAFQTIEEGKIALNRKGGEMNPSVFEAWLIA